MTNEVDLIAAVHAELTEPCLRIAQFALTWGKWFVILAFFAALAQTAAAILVELRRPKSDAQRGLLPDKGWLDSLKGVLEALANLPGWVTIFLAGLVLVWTSMETPARCAANHPGGSAQPGSPNIQPASNRA